MNEKGIAFIRFCVIIKSIKGNRHRVVDLGKRKDLPRPGQSTGEVFATLVTNQVNECQ